MRHRTALFIVLLLSIHAAAQTAGTHLSNAGSFTTGTYTFIDVAHPFTANGTIQYVSLRWNKASCSNAVKLKILRPTSTNYGGTFDVVANSGPYDAQPGTFIYGFGTPVAVQKGDLLAVSQLNPCSGVALGPTNPAERLPALPKDVSASDSLAGASYFQGFGIAAFASSTTDNLAAIVPVAGSVQGGFGAFFRTSLQLANTDNNGSTVKVVFHPQGQPASASDPSLTLGIGAGGAVSYADIIHSMNASGVGSLDVISVSGSLPVIRARIYNDAGDKGTAGFSENAITPFQFLHTQDNGFFMTPLDLTKTRMNVGVRTLSATKLNIATTSVVTRDYPANYFIQTTLAEFLGTLPATPNTAVRINVASGDVIVYASTTDNITNDSSADFVTRQ